MYTPEYFFEKFKPFNLSEDEKIAIAFYCNFVTQANLKKVDSIKNIENFTELHSVFQILFEIQNLKNRLKNFKKFPVADS